MPLPTEWWLFGTFKGNAYSTAFFFSVFQAYHSQFPELPKNNEKVIKPSGMPPWKNLLLPSYLPTTKIPHLPKFSLIYCDSCLN